MRTATFAGGPKSMRTVVGNWKMHRTPEEAARLAAELSRLLPGAGAVEAVVCPPFPDLDAVRSVLAGGVRLGAQNVFWEDRGAYTGEVSAPMLRAAGCSRVIVGHSERRRLLGETDEMVGRKLGACWRHGLVPILCVGETLAEREAGRAAEVLRRQVAAALAEHPAAPLYVAYEPVWAIGTGRAAGPADCADGLAVIRAAAARVWPAGPAPDCLYGGSVTPDNCGPFWEQAGADGALVGGASLDAEAFAAICRSAAGGGPA